MVVRSTSGGLLWGLRCGCVNRVCRIFPFLQSRKDVLASSVSLLEPKSINFRVGLRLPLSRRDSACRAAIRRNGGCSCRGRPATSGASKMLNFGGLGEDRFARRPSILRLLVTLSVSRVWRFKRGRFCWLPIRMPLFSGLDRFVPCLLRGDEGLRGTDGSMLSMRLSSGMSS